MVPGSVAGHWLAWEELRTAGAHLMWTQTGLVCSLLSALWTRGKERSTVSGAKLAARTCPADSGLIWPSALPGHGTVPLLADRWRWWTSALVEGSTTGAFFEDELLGMKDKSQKTKALLPCTFYYPNLGSVLWSDYWSNDTPLGEKASDMTIFGALCSVLILTPKMSFSPSPNFTCLPSLLPFFLCSLSLSLLVWSLYYYAWAGYLH